MSEKNCQMCAYDQLDWVCRECKNKSEYRPAVQPAPVPALGETGKASEEMPVVAIADVYQHSMDKYGKYLGEYDITRQLAIATDCQRDADLLVLEKMRIYYCGLKDSVLAAKEREWKERKERRLEYEKELTAQIVTHTRRELVHEIADKLDLVNAHYGNKDILCYFCHSNRYDSSGIIHAGDCLIAELRRGE